MPLWRKPRSALVGLSATDSERWETWGDPLAFNRKHQPGLVRDSGKKPIKSSLLPITSFKTDLTFGLFPTSTSCSQTAKFRQNLAKSRRQLAPLDSWVSLQRSLQRRMAGKRIGRPLIERRNQILNR